MVGIVPLRMFAHGTNPTSLQGSGSHASNRARQSRRRPINIDQVASRARASGITLKTEPHDTEWGTRAFEVTEPSGFLLTIASAALSR